MPVDNIGRNKNTKDKAKITAIVTKENLLDFSLKSPLMYLEITPLKTIANKPTLIIIIIISNYVINKIPPC